MPGSSECFRAGEIFRVEQLELLERLEPLEQASLRCVQSDGGQSADQTENSFQQSQTILRDLKHHSLPIGRFERLERSPAVERLERAAVIGERPNRVFRFGIHNVLDSAKPLMHSHVT
jgi:hypothetical protein